MRQKKNLKCVAVHKILLLLLVFTAVFMINADRSEAATRGDHVKGKIGFYVGGQSNVRRVAIKKISKKYIYFDMVYADMKEVGASNIKANKKSGKFKYKDDRGCAGSGIIKLYSKYVKLKAKGYSMCSTNNEWRKLKYINNSTDVWTVY